MVILILGAFLVSTSVFGSEGPSAFTPVDQHMLMLPSLRSLDIWSTGTHAEQAPQMHVSQGGQSTVVDQDSSVSNNVVVAPSPKKRKTENNQGLQRKKRRIVPSEQLRDKVVLTEEQRKVVVKLREQLTQRVAAAPQATVQPSLLRAPKKRGRPRKDASKLSPFEAQRLERGRENTRLRYEEFKLHQDEFNKLSGSFQLFKPIPYNPQKN